VLLLRSVSQNVALAVSTEKNEEDKYQLQGQIINQSIPTTDNQKTSSYGHSCEHSASGEQGEED
jgi:hypothetical protein